ncbi:MAG: acyl-CoA thioesterase [Proteobacteria bacterium]|nr:acyl-CoA thioesterase [Desulfobacterales bacterium]MBL6967660.1 acyl-CoA thioesterase [Desulfobacteraceae bacterium]MBU0733474.1 acyl-CoA thioesterase [Pseudomonadota bacterium]MBL7173579.1 acyl-CoA thioesterase [Desulfobacteraceae bacterium]MBU0990333.1 acyl-CoA thioesterase [Pseudomonadota bacterium]
MRPKPFIPEVFNNDVRYVKDRTEGLVWHRCKNRTLYADTDRSQIVYHANHMRFFELGRASLMRDSGCSYREIEESGLIYPIIEVGIKYYSPLYYDDVMWVHTHPAKLERVRIQFDYIITHADSNNIVCKGFTRHCAINSSGTPVAIDEKTLQIWKTFPK